MGKWIRRSCRGIAVAAFLVGALAGCVGSGSFNVSQKPAELPPMPVNEVMTYWEPGIRIITSYPTGAPLPGIAGRVYLMNDDVKDMVDARGEIVVRLHDRTQGADSEKWLQQWIFHEADLKKLKKKDLVGDGYTLFLPWPEYRPEISKIELRLAYFPRGGTPHFAESTPFALRADNTFRIEQRQVVAGGSASK